MLKMDMIWINHTEFFSDVLFQYPVIRAIYTGQNKSRLIQDAT
jgi:hypothetical protein